MSSFALMVLMNRAIGMNVLIILLSMLIAVAQTLIDSPIMESAFVLTIVVICLEVLVLIVLFVWQIWRLWSVKLIHVPQKVDPLASVTGVRLDPSRGIVMDVLHEGESIAVLVNPDYWKFLPSSTISREDGLECPVSGSSFEIVKPGLGPQSLVAISNGTTIVGMGCRVTYLGGTYLLTANHVWQGNATRLYLVKDDYQTEVDLSSHISFGCYDRRVDFVLVKIPDRVWSRLGVKSSPLKPLEKRSIVTCYGMSNSNLMCSTGRADRGVYSHDILHSCSTTNGWSGTPLFYKGAVVGVHCGFKKMGSSNRGSNVGLLMQIASKDETDFSEASSSYISEEEARERDYPFLEVDVVGGRRVSIGQHEHYYPRQDPFAKYGGMKGFENHVKSSGGFVWADEDEFSDSLETLESHLNCQRAETIPRSPPSFLMENMTGKKEVKSLETMECHSISLDDRLSNLEKLVEKLLTVQSSKPAKSSPNSTITIGQIEVPVPSEAPCSSKQVASSKPKRRKRSKNAVKDSNGNTQKPKVEVVLGEKSGTQKQSPKK
nr:MAG: polyprotein P2a [Sobemovirus sp.]